MKVCIGGTFDVLHKGHKRLIDKAFQTAGEKGSVFIGITVGDVIKSKKNVKPYETRKEKIEKYLTKKDHSKKVTFKPIEDKYGPSTDGDFDAIVVSPETIKTAWEINEIRLKNNRTPLVIIQIPFILDNKNIPISTTRIKNNDIDENGNILTED